jgi:mRNA interferase MazF
MTIEPGDIRWFRFSKPDKRRPVLVLVRPELLPSRSLIPVIPLSTQARGLDWEMRLGPADGLRSECVLKPEWVRSVERHRLGSLIATLPEPRWPDVRAAVLSAFGLDRS